MKMIRGIFKKCEDVAKGLKRFSASGRQDETFENRELIQQRGFSSVPKEGDKVLILEVGGLKIAIASHTDDRPELKEGEAAVFSSKDNYIKLTESGEIEIVSKGKTIKVEGSIECSGEVTANAKLPTKVSLSTHIHGTGVGPTTPPTAGT